MRLVTFKNGVAARLGAIKKVNAVEKVIDLNQLDPRIPGDLLQFLGMGSLVLELAEKGLAGASPAAGLDLASVELLAPLPQPGKIICIGQNYLEHARESSADKAPFPIIFAKYSNSIIGTGANIVIPKVVQKPDYEGELAVIIGRKGRSIPESEALHYVGGYSILNDVSARDWQNRTSQWVIGKTCDTFCPFGPVLVTSDEIPDPQTLQIRTIISGQVFQTGNTADMIFSVAHLIADMSQVMTLEPGDIIATGTPPGVGFAQKPPRWLRPGDIVRIEIDRIGVLENPVVAEE